MSALCKWCHYRPAKRDHACFGCFRARYKRPYCKKCKGPIFGAGTTPFCLTCGPYAPPRQPFFYERVCILVDPQGNEREVYRGIGEYFPRGIYCGERMYQRKITAKVPSVITLEVTRPIWLGARLM